MTSCLQHLNNIFNKKKKRAVLLYDHNCFFCDYIAHLLQRIIGKGRLLIVPNENYWAGKLYVELNAKNKGAIHKNVHLILCDKENGLVLYSGSDAAINTLALLPYLKILKYLNRVFILRWIFKLSYFIIKKIKIFYYNNF